MHAIWSRNMGLCCDVWISQLSSDCMVNSHLQVVTSALKPAVCAMALLPKATGQLHALIPLRVRHLYLHTPASIKDENIVTC